MLRTCMRQTRLVFRRYSSKSPKAHVSAEAATGSEHVSPQESRVAASGLSKPGVALELAPGTYTSEKEQPVSPHILQIIDKFDQLEQMAREGNTKNADYVATQISVLQQREVTRLISQTFSAHPMRRTLLGNMDPHNPWNDTSDAYLWASHKDGVSFFEPPYNRTISPDRAHFKEYEEGLVREVGERKPVMVRRGGRMKVDRAALRDLRKQK